MDVPPLTTAEAAQVLKIDRRTVTSWAREGYIKPYKRLPGAHGGFLFSVSEVARVAALPVRTGGRPRKAPAQRETLPDAS